MPGPILLPQLPAPKYPVKPVPVDPPPPPEPVKRRRTVIEPEAVLVSGLAYPRERGEKIRDVFSNYCKTMAKRLNKKYPGIVITVFNFYEGAQQIYEFDGKSPEPIITLVKTWGKLNVDNYRYYNWTDDTIETKKPGPEKEIPYMLESDKQVYYFIGISDVFGSASVAQKDYGDAVHDGKIKEKSISIQNVYSYIEGLGRYKPGNLKELHFFSRGESDDGSPSLTHSYFAGYMSSTGKFKFSSKFVNKDGAPGDFSDFPYSTVIKKLSDFEAAFAKDCITVLWGSFLNRKVFDLINGVLHSKEYKKMLKDPDDKLYDYLGTPMSLNNIIEEIHEKYLKDSYAHHMGEATHRTGGKNIHLAPPGTDANTDNEVTQKKYGDPLLHIFMGEDFGDPPGQDFHEILKFYYEAIGVKFLSTPGEYHKTYGRGYMKVY